MDTTAIPSPIRETTIMSVWPSISATRLGQVLGRAYAFGPRINILTIPFRPGWLLALALIPLSLLLYFAKIVPRVGIVFGPSNPLCRRYRLTTGRVVIEHPFDALSQQRSEQAVKASVALGEFDSIEVDERPGQEWYQASDLVFRHEGSEVLRLRGVRHPESFRHTCQKANASHRGMDEIRGRGLAV